jgi:hypothetical protein
MSNVNVCMNCRLSRFRAMHKAKVYRRESQVVVAKLVSSVSVTYVNSYQFSRCLFCLKQGRVVKQLSNVAIIAVAIFVV